MYAAGHANFNSIKVQLELKRFDGKGSCIRLFQFHKGTIRTKEGRGLLMQVLLFQFHKGTIRTLILISSVIIL